MFEADSEDEIENAEYEVENIEIDGQGDIEQMKNSQEEEKDSEDELEQLELREEQYLKVDAVAKQQFEYNKNICLANDFPELQVKIQNQDDPISLAPGEGIVHIQYNLKVIFI